MGSIAQRGPVRTEPPIHPPQPLPQVTHTLSPIALLLQAASDPRIRDLDCRLIALFYARNYDHWQSCERKELAGVLCRTPTTIGQAINRLIDASYLEMRLMRVNKRNTKVIRIIRPPLGSVVEGKNR